MIVIHPPEVTAWQLPEDGDAAKAAFLRYFADPTETWLRAYALTMSALAQDIIAAHKNGVLLHLYVDKSQTDSAEQLTVVKSLVEAGVETTIGTAPTGRSYIAHEKGYATSGGDCWEGSVNFSDEAWEQVNTALQFHSPQWRDMTIAAFNRDVQFAWSNERAYQLMGAPPASFTP